MIEEAYVSFELAQKLKEKGFDEECTHYITRKHKTTEAFSYGCVYKNSDDGDDDIYCCPTQQMAMRWLREEHSLFISINVGIYGDEKEILWDYIVGTINKAGLSYPQVDASFCFNTYEEACEAAIKYCLENLIK